MQSFSTFFEATKTHGITTTDNKLQVIKNENEFIHKYNDGKSGELYGVVGNIEGLTRHIRQFQDIGYPISQMTIFELDSTTFKELSLHGRDMGVMVKNQTILTPSDKVTHVDFDITADADNFKRDLETILKIFPNLKTCVMVYARGRTSVADNEYPESIKILDYLDTPSDKKSFFKLYTQMHSNNGVTARQQYIINVINSHPELTFYVQPYKGAGGVNMVSITFAKVPGDNKDAANAILSSTKSIQTIRAAGKSIIRDIQSFKADNWRDAIKDLELLDLNWNRLEAERKKLRKLE